MKYYKNISREQNAALVNEAVTAVHFRQPKHGWIKTVRAALSMSGAVLSQRLGGHRSTASYLERSEQNGNITLNKLREAAAAMECDLVYALVPKNNTDQSPISVEDLLHKQADRKAQAIVKSANVQMALEAQQLDEPSLQKEIERLRNRLLNTLPKELWQRD